jgi:hypothetical protein
MAQLSTLDFCSALCVCTRWNTAAKLVTSWPSYDMSDVIAGLRTEKVWWYEGTRMRKRAISFGCNALPMVQTYTLASMSTAPASPIWKNARQINIRQLGSTRGGTSVDSNRGGVEEINIGTLLPQFPHLVALHLQLYSKDGFAAMESVWKPLQTRLEILILPLCNTELIGSALQHIRMLTCLRVLSIPVIPPADAISDMHQLEAICVSARCHEFNMFGFMDAIVQLSTVHRLRVVCVEDANSRKLSDWFDADVAKPADQAVQITPLPANSTSGLHEFIACHWRPTGTHLQNLASRFSVLTRLSCSQQNDLAFKAQVAAALCRQLKFLKVITFKVPLDAFALCDALEEAYLHIDPPSSWSWPISWTSTLQHLTLCLRRVDTYETFEGFRALRGLVSLTFYPSLVSDQFRSLVQALSTLPRFARLDVGVEVDIYNHRHLSYPDLVTSHVWELIARRATWTTLRLRLNAPWTQTFSKIEECTGTYTPTNFTCDAELAHRLSFYVQLPSNDRTHIEFCLRLVKTSDASHTYMWEGACRSL